MRILTLALSAASLAFAGPAFAQPSGGPQGGPPPQSPMTRADAAAQADRIFARLDVNGDGKLDKADREARRSGRFDRLDTDGNGAISRAEFDAAAGKLRDRFAGRDRRGRGFGKHGLGSDGAKGPGGPGGPGFGMGGHRGAGLAMIGKMADTNGDGAISKDEFRTAALAMFDRADANGDGTVTPDERMQMHRTHRGERRGGHAPVAE